MEFVEPGAETPLLLNVTSPQPAQTPNYHSIFKSHSGASAAHTRPLPVQRSLEDDILPETAVSGRNLGWGSAYILIIARVIGSGIFATPGAIVRSVGSVGLSLGLWVAGAVISWCGLAVALEYGCMLPRSGG
jgi:amino acid permease